MVSKLSRLCTLYKASWFRSMLNSSQLNVSYFSGVVILTLLVCLFTETLGDVSISITPKVGVQGESVSIHCITGDIEPWVFIIRRAPLDGDISDGVKAVEYLHNNVGQLHESIRTNERASFSSNALNLHRAHRLNDTAQYRCEVIDSEIERHMSSIARLKVVGEFDHE